MTISSESKSSMSKIPSNKRRMILHVVPAITVEHGGSTSTMGTIIQMWNTEGIQAHVLSIQTPGTPLGLDAETTVCPPSFPARLSNSFPALRWYLRNGRRFDLVVFHSTWSILNVVIAAAARAMSLPYVVVSHSSLDPFDLQKKSGLKRILGPLVIRRYLQGGRGIICSTQLEKERIVTYGAKPRIHVLPWTVHRVPSNESREKVRARYGFAPDEVIILALGRVDYKKGFPVLIPALRRLLEAGYNTRLVIVGPDSRGYLGKVRQMVATEGVGKATVFLDTISGAAKTALMEAVDCFALPSLNENFGNVVVEAMQSGLPVVISNNVYIADTIAAAGGGLVCNYDVQEVFLALKKLVENRHVREEMGRVAKETGKLFSAEVLQEKYQHLAKELLLESAPAAMEEQNRPAKA